MLLLTEKLTRSNCIFQTTLQEHLCSALGIKLRRTLGQTMKRQARQLPSSIPLGQRKPRRALALLVNFLLGALGKWMGEGNEQLQGKQGENMHVQIICDQIQMFPSRDTESATREGKNTETRMNHRLNFGKAAEAHFFLGGGVTNRCIKGFLN